MSATIEASLRLEIAQYQAALARAKGDASKFRDQLKRTGSGLGKDLFGPLKGYLGAIGLAAVGKQMFDAVLKLDGLEKMLRVTEGSAAGAARRMGELRDVGRLPGLSMEAAIQGDIRLRAIGFSAQESKRIIMEMGNALSLVGGTQEDLNGVFLALSQISSKGKVSAEELNQIAERLPQVRKVMKEVFGTSNSEEIQKLGIEANAFISGLVDGFAKLERAQPGLREDLTEISTIFTQLYNDVAGPMVRELVPGFREMATAIASNKEAFQSLGQAAASSVTSLAQVADWINSTVTAASKLTSLMSLGMGELFSTGSVDAARQLIAATLDQDQAAKDLIETEKILAQLQSDKLAQAKAITDATDAIASKAAADARTATAAAKLTPADIDENNKSAKDKRAKDPFEATLNAQEKLDAAKRDAAEDEMGRSEKIADLRKRLAEADIVDPFGVADASVQIENETRKIEMQRKLNGLLKDERDARRKVFAEVAEAAKASATKFAAQTSAQSQATRTLVEEVALLEAKADGNDKLVAALEKEFRIRDKTKDIQSQTGATDAQARRAAENIVSLEDQANETDPKKKRKMKSRYMEGGIYRFNELQRGRGESLFGTSRSLAGGEGGLAYRGTRNANKADAAGRDNQTLESINKAMLDALKTLAYGP